jgi:hypothetical protein
MRSMCLSVSHLHTTYLCAARWQVAVRRQVCAIQASFADFGLGCAEVAWGAVSLDGECNNPLSAECSQSPC